MTSLVDLIKQAIVLPKPKKNVSKKDPKNEGCESKKKPTRKRPRASQEEIVSSEEEQINPKEILVSRLAAIVSHCEKYEAQAATGSLSSSSSSLTVYGELWHYLQKELFNRTPLHRLRTIKLIHFLAVALPKFRAVLAEELQWIARAAGLLRSVAHEQQSKERVRGTAEEVKQIEDEVKRVIDQWDYLFGRDVEKFHVMRRYFAESLKLSMPDMKQQAAKDAALRQKRESSNRRKTLVRAEKIAKKGLWAEERESIEVCVRAIEECFSILFPDIVSTAPAVRVSSEATEDDVQDVDWSAIEWVGEDEDEDEPRNDSKTRFQEENEDDLDDDDTFLQSSHTLPFTIEFELATTAAEVMEENGEIVQIVRENATQLMRKSVPKLERWKDVLQKAIFILEGIAQQQCALSSSQEQKSMSLLQAHSLLSQFRRTAKEFELTAKRLQELLTGRCKEMLCDK